MFRDSRARRPAVQTHGSRAQAAGRGSRTRRSEWTTRSEPSASARWSGRGTRRGCPPDFGAVIAAAAISSPPGEPCRPGDCCSQGARSWHWLRFGWGRPPRILPRVMQPWLQNCCRLVTDGFGADLVGAAGVSLAARAVDAAHRALAQPAPAGGGAGARRAGGAAAGCAQPGTAGVARGRDPRGGRRGDDLGRRARLGRAGARARRAHGRGDRRRVSRRDRRGRSGRSGSRSDSGGGRWVGCGASCAGSGRATTSRRRNASSRSARSTTLVALVEEPVG